MFPISGTKILALAWLGGPKARLAAYGVIKAIGMATIVDPELEHTLTFLNGFAEKVGYPLVHREDVNIVAKVEKLAGTKLEITYVRNRGITFIEVLDEDSPLPISLLENIAYNSSLLLDYYVLPNQDKKIGDEWEVNARDIAGVVSFDLGVNATGFLKMRRGENDTIGDEDVFQIEVVGGQIEATFESVMEKKFATLIPKQCTIKYSPDKLMVREARLEWEISKVDVNENHLLAGTNTIKATVESYYEADRRGQADSAD